MFSYADLMPLPGIYSTITIKYLQKKVTQFVWLSLQKYAFWNQTVWFQHLSTGDNWVLITSKTLKRHKKRA